MKDFLARTADELDWYYGPEQLIFMGLLLLWLWLIWPSDEFKALLTDKAKQTQILLASVALNALWLLNANVTQGIHVHFLGIVTLMLMYGWRMASVISILPVLFFTTFVIKSPFDFAIYGLLGINLPLFLCFMVYSQIFKYLPHHLFVYIFGGAFINAFLSILFHILLWAAWLWLSTDYDWAFLRDNYLLVIPLLGFPEALLNGMAITLLVVYRPQWLYDYSDSTYLK
ncbi:energy-coupling factor ABC transporter permease [Shewanella nanhaiensis]|uniref:Energy-coupling factor ABC transporter permease n=1 Tax=Shewanella nanhaiensis TaxID=2864872 RepID=A0ABS7E030_9GAMM|nr:energy-coupling factor ABC transporter permease [Shewanella nanhaiensis]MBW8183053.1 energy-coupling factor ABC transporter permease [Shewanella nanhaiensis]